jgi:hypothetical protein
MMRPSATLLRTWGVSTRGIAAIAFVSVLDPR